METLSLDVKILMYLILQPVLMTIHLPVVRPKLEQELVNTLWYSIYASFHVICVIWIRSVRIIPLDLLSP